MTMTENKIENNEMKVRFVMTNSLHFPKKADFQTVLPHIPLNLPFNQQHKMLPSGKCNGLC